MTDEDFTDAPAEMQISDSEYEPLVEAGRGNFYARPSNAGISVRESITGIVAASSSDRLAACT